MMNELRELLKAPTFWFASIFVAFLMSLIGAFAKDLITKYTLKFYGRLKSQRLKRFLEEDKEILAQAEKIRGDKFQLLMYRIDSVHLKLRQIIYLLVVYITFFFALYGLLSGQIKVTSIFAFATCLFWLPLSHITKKYRKTLIVLDQLLDSESVEPPIRGRLETEKEDDDKKLNQ